MPASYRFRRFGWTAGVWGFLLNCDESRRPPFAVYRQRIMRSILCMATSFGIFAVIVIVIGWIEGRG